MRVFGIDPGYAIVGYGVLDTDGRALHPVCHGAITTQSHLPFEDRLQEIYQDLCGLISEFNPDTVAIESLFYTTNQKTVIAVAQARGVIILAAKLAALPIFEYTPLQVKQGVSGYGKASKKQVQEMTRRVLNLEKIPKPDDAADALAIAVCHAHSFKSLQRGKALTKHQQMGYY